MKPLIHKGDILVNVVDDTTVHVAVVISADKPVINLASCDGDDMVSLLDESSFDAQDFHIIDEATYKSMSVDGWEGFKAKLTAIADKVAAHEYG